MIFRSDVLSKMARVSRGFQKRVTLDFKTQATLWRYTNGACPHQAHDRFFSCRRISLLAFNMRAHTIFRPDVFSKMARVSCGLQTSVKCDFKTQATFWGYCDGVMVCEKWGVSASSATSPCNASLFRYMFGLFPRPRLVVWVPHEMLLFLGEEEGRDMSRSLCWFYTLFD